MFTFGDGEEEAVAETAEGDRRRSSVEIGDNPRRPFPFSRQKKKPRIGTDFHGFGKAGLSGAGDRVAEVCLVFSEQRGWRNG